MNSNKKKETGKVSPLCSICQDAAGRYKCPRCRLPYCSVICCKTHKETCGQQQQQQSPQLQDTDSRSPPDADTPATIASQEQLPTPLVSPHPPVSTTAGSSSSSSSSGSSSGSGSGSTSGISSGSSSSNGELDIITEQQKQQLARSREVCDKIVEIDGAGVNRRSLLKKARANPEFEGFVDLILRTVEPKTPQQQ